MKKKVIMLLALAAVCAAAAASGSTGPTLQGKMAVATLAAPVTAERPQAGGGFNMVFEERSRTLGFWLRFGHLSGDAISAQLRIQLPGATAPVVITLCKPCKTSLVKRTLALKSRTAALISKSLRVEDNQGFSGLSVSVNTRANPTGELGGPVYYLCNPCPDVLHRCLNSHDPSCGAQ